MLKFGISNPEQIYSKKHLGVLGARRFIALDLYNVCQNRLTKEEAAYFQERILNRFSISNKTFKYTHSNRFDDFDYEALKVVKNIFTKDKRLLIHDIGVSDARTCCDFIKALTIDLRNNFEYLATDYAPELYVVSKENNYSKRLVIDQNDNILQTIYPPFVFNEVHPENKLFYPINFVVRKILNKVFSRKLLKDYLNKKDDIDIKTITLLCREFVELMYRNANIRFEKYDILSGPKEKFDVIRVMNLLNSSYFNEADLRKALSNISDSLNETGVFIVGSNLEPGSIVNGGVYKKCGSKFVKLYESGEGAIIDKFITDQKH
jgi:hypothetical protein